MDRIETFSGAFAFLSNFFPAKVQWEGQEFPTSEAAFQAAKTTDKDERAKIAALDTPGKAKRAGKKVQLRPNWTEPLGEDPDDRTGRGVGAKGLSSRLTGCAPLSQYLGKERDRRDIDGFSDG